MTATDWAESLSAGLATVLALLLLLASFLTGHVAGIQFDQLRDQYRVVQTADGPTVVEER